MTNSEYQEPTKDSQGSLCESTAARFSQKGTLLSFQNPSLILLPALDCLTCSGTHEAIGRYESLSDLRALAWMQNEGMPSFKQRRCQIHPLLVIHDGGVKCRNTPEKTQSKANKPNKKERLAKRQQQKANGLGWEDVKMLNSLKTKIRGDTKRQNNTRHMGGGEEGAGAGRSLFWLVLLLVFFVVLFAQKRWCVQAKC